MGEVLPTIEAQKGLFNDRDALTLQAKLFGRYLVSIEPDDVLVERYVSAIRTLFSSAPADRLTTFAVRHPWALGLRDAALIWRRRKNPLRQRLVVMSAILETTTRHADYYLPRALSAIPLAGLLAVCGTITVLKTIAGIPLVLFLREKSL